MLDPEKRLPLEEVHRHPWIVQHCVEGERAAQRSSGLGKEKKSDGAT